MAITPQDSRPVCEPTGKIIYLFLLDILREHPDHPRTVRAYACEHTDPDYGRHWHVTSRHLPRS